ncbi:hypothetical protein [Pleionea mediterranea]|jgi:hypothetical protein|uniref:Uncharacterized protein n=1 Tax=Pleionea mediterranea TaxID=523701 RepID=A0A316FLV3_9GAMM|nr:hypothetical protein [Pleionea mediterranea]PWK49253.1 hypothetical protein C8D97_108163 [Pleionea mediterranea]
MNTMNTRRIKHRAFARSNLGLSGEFLFRRERRGPANQLTDELSRMSRSKISEK